jgi:hypothetical protein
MTGPSQGTELQPRERRWTLRLLVVGGAILTTYGTVTHYWEALAAGVVVVIFFGAVALGAKRARAGAGTVSAEAEWAANDPPPGPRTIYLPSDPASRDQDR